MFAIHSSCLGWPMPTHTTSACERLTSSITHCSSSSVRGRNGVGRVGEPSETCGGE